MTPTPQTSPLFPYTTLFRSEPVTAKAAVEDCPKLEAVVRKLRDIERRGEKALIFTRHVDIARSEEHTSELQSRVDRVCRLLLGKKKLAYVLACRDVQSGCGR